MTRNPVRKVVALTFAAAALTAGGTLAATGSAQADDSPGAQRGYEGCGHGSACIYPDGSWDKNPEHSYWSYGVHPLHNEVGVHRLFNNQKGGATVSLCKGADGTNCGDPMGEFMYKDIDLTPYNSIRLDR